MLTRLYIDNFRCFVNFEFKPGRRQLILGGNGSGKSSLMDALLLIRQFACLGDRLHELRFLEQRTRWMSNPGQSWVVEASLENQSYVYRLVLEPSGSPANQLVASETVHLEGKPLIEFARGRVHLFNDQLELTASYPFDCRRSALATITAGRDHRQLSRFQQWLASLAGFQINPFQIASQVGEDDSEPKPNLSNLASWYRSLAQNHPKQDRAFTKDLQDVISGFGRLRFDLAGKFRLLMAEFSEGPEKLVAFDFDELSEGQRCLICLYAILHFLLAKGATVIIDEPDNFISLREIQPWLMAATETVEGGSGQLILISHHPEILNQWAPDCGIRFVRDGVGPVRVQEFRGDPESALSPAEIVARGWEND